MLNLNYAGLIILCICLQKTDKLYDIKIKSENIFLELNFGKDFQLSDLISTDKNMDKKFELKLFPKIKFIILYYYKLYFVMIYL